MRPEENEALTRVGPGTLMGDFMRQYWFPVLKSSELEAGGAPVRFRFLGENMLGFRSPDGSVGVVDHRCAHRCASLFFGRNEEGGLRCIYHGWKFDTSGQCIDMPSEPPATEYSARVKIKAAAVVEKYGCVWACLAEPGKVPEFPKFDMDQVPDDQIEVDFFFRECNWLQGLEADIDTVHVGFLHMGSTKPLEFEEGSTNYYRQINLAPQYEAIETDYGTMYTAYRPAGEGKTYHRVGQFIFPSMTIAAQDPLGIIKLRSWIPVDDDHCMLVVMDGPRPAPTAVDKHGNKLPGLFEEGEYLPNTTDWLGRWRLAQNPSNDYYISREAQKTVNYSGIIGGRVQDQAIIESMGNIVDRSLENLGTSDTMIVRTRRRLLAAVNSLRDEGLPAPGSTDARLFAGIRSGFVTLPADTDWLDKVNEERKAWAGDDIKPIVRPARRARAATSAE